MRKHIPLALSPMGWGKLFIDELFRSPRGVELKWWRDEFYRWTGTHYTMLPRTELAAVVLGWLDERTFARPRHSADIATALASLTRVDFAREAPCFLEGKTDPSNIIPFPNGLLDIHNLGGDLEMREHTPVWFCFNCMAYPFDPAATCETWCKFLDEVVGDAEGVELLQRFFGLCLTPDTSYQKLLLIAGPKRSGKGTALRILQHILGSDACVSPSLSSLAGEFGLSQLVGKSVGMFADAHLGRRIDSIRVLETIKTIVGEDSVSVNRKNKPFLNVRLPIRFIITVNELPRFNDPTLALEARLLPLMFPTSFAGREDRHLEGRLKAEASGILNWSLVGLHKLRQDGRFIVPHRSEDVMQSYKRLASPILGFVEDRCLVSPDAEVGTNELYEAWGAWCEANGYKQGSNATFGEHLRSTMPEIRRVRKHDRAVNKRWYSYVGIELAAPGP